MTFYTDDVLSIFERQAEAEPISTIVQIYDRGVIQSGEMLGEQMEMFQLQQMLNVAGIRVAEVIGGEHELIAPIAELAQTTVWVQNGFAKGAEDCAKYSLGVRKAVNAGEVKNAEAANELANLLALFAGGLVAFNQRLAAMGSA